MLTYGVINKIKDEIMNDYKENYGKYNIYLTAYQKYSCFKKYSKGGASFPFGMYFVSEISEKIHKSKAGQFVQQKSKYDFEYDLSDDDRIKIITKKNHDRTFVAAHDDLIKLYKYEMKPNHNSIFPLIEIGYKFKSGKNDIFVHANSFSGSGDFFFDIEILTEENGAMKGGVYHLMSNDYSLIYGEDTPDLICDDYDEVVFQ